MRSRNYQLTMFVLSLVCGFTYQGIAQQFDAFPPLEVSSLKNDVFVRPALRVHSGRDLEEIPDGSGRFLIMRGTNTVRITRPGQTMEKTFLVSGPSDVSDTEGSVSIEIHPGFATPGHPGFGKFYTIGVEKNPEVEADYVSENPDHYFHSILTEWTATDPTADRFAGTSRELMRFSMASRIHNVNDMAFGPDELLYIAVGEDQAVEQSSDLSSLYGKVLRIDPLGTDGPTGKYGIPADNPFVDYKDAAPEVFAYGLRNPWRLNIDRETGDVFVGDIGHRSIEEANLIEAGKTYGWPYKEGSFIQGDMVTPDLPDPDTGLTVAETFNLVDPLFEVDRSEMNAIMGGVLYRGKRFPELVGKYIFGAWNFADIFVGDPETGTVEVLMERGKVKESFNNTENERFVSINEDQDGEIYLVGGFEVRALFRYPDFDDSGRLDGPDGDAICNDFGSESSLHDLNGDLKVDIQDIGVLLDFANALPGDLDLNGEIEFADFLQIARHFEDEAPLWSDGDVNCDGVITFPDFLQLSDNFGEVRAAAAHSIPEPSGAPLLMLGIVMVLGSRSGPREK